MWRLWTRGWGVRSWWYWFRYEGFPFWVARQLPDRVTYWAYIRVMVKGDLPPCSCFKDVSNRWVTGWKVK